MRLVSPAEGAIAVGFRSAREIADRVDRAFYIGKQIEPGVLVPGVPRQNFERAQANMIGEVLAGRREQLVEHPAHREHGRAAVDRDAPIATCRILPPGDVLRSSTVTSSPRAASAKAETSPPTPAPTMTTRSLGMLSAGSALSIDMCPYLFTLLIDKSN